MTSITGTVVSQQWYYPYGETRAISGTVPTTLGFTGQRRDEGVGSLMFYRARYYSPLLSRFVSADTLVPEPGNSQALNRYRYVYNSPMKYVDPTGHLPTPCANPDGYGYGSGCNANGSERLSSENLSQQEGGAVGEADDYCIGEVCWAGGVDIDPEQFESPQPELSYWACYEFLLGCPSHVGVRVELGGGHSFSIFGTRKLWHGWGGLGCYWLEHRLDGGPNNWAIT